MRSRTSGTCSAALGIAAPDPGAFPVDMAVDASAARGRQRLAAAVSPRRRSSSSYTSARAIRSAGGLSPHSRGRRQPCRRRHLASSSPRGRLNAPRRRGHRSGAGTARGRGRAAGFSRAAISRWPNCARLSTAHRCTSAATAARCMSRRRAGVPIVGLYGPTLPARSAPWRRPTFRRALEVFGLPCRPCEQRAARPATSDA